MEKGFADSAPATSGLSSWSANLRESEGKGVQRTWAVCFEHSGVLCLASLVQGAATGPCHSIRSRTCFSLHRRS